MKFLTVLLLSLLFVAFYAGAPSTRAADTDDDKPSFSGHAHWYGKELHGHRTASGAVFDKDKLTAAHPDIKFGTKVRVVSRLTKKEVVVEINDRCPVRSYRVIDLSEGAAKEIGIWPGTKNDVDCYIVAGAKKQYSYSIS